MELVGTQQQGPAGGRKRLPNRDRPTAEDDALNQIAREVRQAGRRRWVGPLRLPRSAPRPPQHASSFAHHGQVPFSEEGNGRALEVAVSLAVRPLPPPALSGAPLRPSPISGFASPCSDFREEPALEGSLSCPREQACQRSLTDSLELAPLVGDCARVCQSARAHLFPLAINGRARALCVGWVVLVLDNRCAGVLMGSPYISWSSCA